MFNQRPAGRDKGELSKYDIMGLVVVGHGLNYWVDDVLRIESYPGSWPCHSVRRLPGVSLPQRLLYNRSYGSFGL